MECETNNNRKEFVEIFEAILGSAESYKIGGWRNWKTSAKNTLASKHFLRHTENITLAKGVSHWEALWVYKVIRANG
jgi:hypothetical protein